MEGPDFLKQKYNLHNSPEAESAKDRTEIRTGESVSQRPKEVIQNYLDRFNEILDREDTDQRERGVEAIKSILHQKFVIKADEIPEAYFENQKRIAREQGHGDIEISDQIREQLSEVIIADQESSLDKWIDYLSSSDATYPDWLKYFAVRSILGMGEYDKEKKQFSKRSTGTTKPFPDLNREALSYVLDAINQKYAGTRERVYGPLEKNDQEFENILANENFAKLYAFAIDKCTPASQEAMKEVHGEWVKYEKNSDHMPLVNSLQGHGTGWCTAGESTAEKQLRDGDFYVYYSFDQHGNPTIPRAAIRMHGNEIAEVRGVAKEQNLDPLITPIVQEKLKEFPDGKQYKKKTEDMKRLTVIEQKIKLGEDVSKEDLRFLYEIDDPIQGFGYDKDPRVDEILLSRNEKADLSFVFDVPEEKVSTTKEEALSGDIVFHCGDLYLNNLTTAEGLTLPPTVRGSLDLSSLTSAEGLTLPQTFRGFLNLRGLTSAEGLTLPQTVGDDLYLSSLTSAEGLTLPQTVGGDLYLRGLTHETKNILRKKYPNLKIF